MGTISSAVGYCVVSALLLASDQPSAGGKSKEQVLVSTPQLALARQAGRTPSEIWLVRLTSHTLTYKTSASASKEKTLKGARYGLVCVQLANGDIFRFRKSTGAFTRYDPLERSYINDQPQESPPETLCHHAEGTGTTGDEAIRDALRNAVRMAVGVLVEGEVLVKQEDVISNKVLTYSDGFVSSYEELKRDQKDGLVHVTICAHVERRKLLADLRKAGISLNAADGKGLVASALTRKDAVEAEADLLKKALGTLPNLLVAEVRPPTALDYEIDTQKLPLSISIRIDRKKYLEFAAKLDSLLSKMSLAHGGLILQARPTVGVGDHFLDWAEAYLDPAIHFGPALPGNPRTWCLWLVAKADDRYNTIRLNCHVLDADITQALEGTRGKLQVEVTFLDAEKNVIHRETFAPEVGGKYLSHWLGWLNPRPRLLRTYSDNTTAPLIGTNSIADLGPAVNSDNTVNAFVASTCIGGLQNNVLLYARGIWIAPKIKIAPEKLEQMKEIRARIVFEPAGGAKPETGGS
jgi:hypothetical protein